MIAADPATDAPTLHLVAPPEWAPLHAHTSIGRMIPSCLAARTLRNHPGDIVVTVGGSSALHEARRLGIHPTAHAALVLGRPRSLVRRLSRRADGCARVVCWADELVDVATRLGPPCTLVSTAPNRRPPRSERPERVLVVEPSDIDRWDAPAATHDRELADLLTAPAPNAGVRAAARDALGIDDDTLCLAALEDNPSHVDARQFTFMLGLLNVSGHDIVGIVPRAAARTTQARRHHEGLKRPFRLLIAEDPLPAIAPAIDACIINPEHAWGSSALLTRWLEATGTRVIDLSIDGRRGFSRSQRVAARILERINAVAEEARNEHTPRSGSTASVS